jgi:hypothetical protein
MITAKELFLKTTFPTTSVNNPVGVELWLETNPDAQDAIKLMIEFAKIKVEEALKIANQKSRIKIGPNNYKASDYLREEILVTDVQDNTKNMWISVYADSILNAYPLENIK